MPADQLSTLTIASRIEVSTRWPMPLRWRAWSASRIPCAAKIPPSRSQIAIPTRIGPLSSVPVTLISPEKPCAIWSNPGVSRIGPLAPKPEIEHPMMRGLREASVS